MFVAASTTCFPDLSLDAALSKLVDLEFSRVEIDISEGGNHLKPSAVHADLEGAILACRETQRLTPVAFSLEIDGEGPPYFDQFQSICKLAKAVKVVCLTVRAGELGAPFNAEVDRLRELVRIATLDGVGVGLKTEIGRLTQDPETALVLCEHVKGLRITLDPSHYTCGPFAGANYDPLFRHTVHMQLRDTSKTKLQVRVGQGEIEYSRLVAQLARFKYHRALCVHFAEDPGSGVDHMAEMRKMRLLLESLL